MPPLRIEHMVTPSPLTRFGQKGIGESGAIGPPAAIACAVNGRAPAGLRRAWSPACRSIPARLRAQIAAATCDEGRRRSTSPPRG